MEKLTEDQIKRQDFVDNQIYDLVKRLNPSRSEIELDIEMVADIRDTIQHLPNLLIFQKIIYNSERFDKI